jgi:AcrR family transcriptional regulator
VSPAAPRWQRRPESRRDELLDAATALLQARPLAEVKVSDVTEAAGTSKGTFYTYFSTKEELYAALKERYLDGLTEVMDRARRDAGSDDWCDRMDAAIEAIVAYMYETDELIEVWDSEKGAPGEPDVFLIGSNRIASQLAAEIGEETAAGRLACDDPFAAAMLIVHAIDATVSHDMMGRTGPQRLGPERVARAAQRMIRGLVRPTRY